MAQHKAGRLKQSNKKHKLPGTTKGSRDQRDKGRVAGKRSGNKGGANHSQGGGYARLMNHFFYASFLL